MQKKYEYLIIGAGYVAKHFCHYLTMLEIPYQWWSRQKDKRKLKLEPAIDATDKILLLIADDAIENFILQNPSLRKKTLIHFSGSLITNLAYGIHPLMTFNNQLYSFDTYKKIFFVTEIGAPPFSVFFPKLKNKSFSIKRELKPFYHALCVLCGSGTILLWQKFFHELESRLKLPKTAAQPFLKQIMLNILDDPGAALTGPLTRGDRNTLISDLKALDNDPFKKIYQTFVNLYEKKNEHT